MTTPPTPLTAAQLARYLGAECLYIQDMGVLMGGYRPINATLTIDLLLLLQAEATFEVRPVLRRLSSITPEQAREVMNLAGLNPGGGPVEITTVAGSIRLDSAGRRFLDMLPDGNLIPSTILGATSFNAVAVVDYLVSQGFDLYGYLDSGLALEKP